MKNVLICLAFLGMLSIAFAATSTGYYGDPKYPGQCVIRPGVIVSAGTHNRSPDGCERITCSDNGYADIATCGIQGAGPGCKMGGYKNPDADYPDCCLREIICE